MQNIERERKIKEMVMIGKCVIGQLARVLRG